MNHWDLIIIRGALLHDLQEFIHAGYYDNATNSVEHAICDTMLAKSIFFSTNPKISARQYAASELLMWVGMYSGNRTLLDKLIGNKLQEHPETREAYTQLVNNNKRLMEDISVSCQRYALHLPDNESKPLLSFIQKSSEEQSRISLNEVENFLGAMSNTGKKITKASQDKMNYLNIAKSLWDKNPKMNKKQIMDSSELHNYMGYQEKTRWNWLTEIDPRPREKRAGRPPKNILP